MSLTLSDSSVRQAKSIALAHSFCYCNSSDKFHFSPAHLMTGRKINLVCELAHDKCNRSRRVELPAALRVLRSKIRSEVQESRSSEHKTDARADDRSIGAPGNISRRMSGKTKTQKTKDDINRIMFVPSRG